MNYNNTRRSISIPLIIAISVIAGIVLGINLPGERVIPHTKVTPKSDKLGTILNIIEADYVDDVDRNALTEAAIPAILEKLDPHSTYIPARDLKRLNEPMMGNFEGIGISFNMITDTVQVMSVISGGPSEKAGLMGGDKIIFVNDSLVAGVNMPDEEVIGMLKGPRGSTVSVKVLRRGAAELIAFEIVRDKIPLYSIDVAYMVSKSTGYIKISTFSLTTFTEFQNAIADLKGKGLKNLIVDLRGNPGGVMEPAIMIADQFLPENKLIVFTIGRSQPRQEYKSSSSGTFKDGKLVILIDEGSASGSEIIAGAVQDNDRGTIIGRRSFGKGLVQEPLTFRDGSGLRLTIARYYTPTGRSIQKSYSNGNEEYFDEIHRRILNGERLNPDSIAFPDSLKFITPGGKVLYGGGGIMPDIFIPIDTTGVSEYFIKAINEGHIYRFSLYYTENNRVELTSFTDATSLEAHLDKQDLLNKFVRFASERGLKPDSKGLKISGETIGIYAKAYIARNILDNKGFYPISGKLDKTLNHAIEWIEDPERN